MFVGRERELAQIGAALEGAAAGRGQLVLLAGEPGIGKTSLADRAAALAVERGFTVLWGRCWEAGGAPAYWPWLDLIAELARGLDDAALARVVGDGASLLCEIVPELHTRLAETPPGAAPPVEEGRFRLWRAVSALVHEATKAKPAFLVLDDLHACDQSSLSLLHFVARQLRPMRVLLLGSYRDVEARMDAATSDLLSRVGREGTTLSLPRLDRAAASRFVQERIGSVASDIEARVYDRSQGNPLFLEEMLRLWNEQGAEAITEGVVPHGVRDVIRQRLDRVAAETRALIDLAAVAGDVIDAPLLAAAAGRDAAWVSARLAEAGRAGVLAERGGHRRFGHALFREVLYRDLAEDARRALHGRVAEALGRLAPAQLAEIAHHALEGPPEMLGRAVEHAIRAAARGAGAARLRRGRRHAGPRAGRGDRRGQPGGAARARAAGAGRGAHPARRGGGRQGRLPRSRGAGALARRRRDGRARRADLRQGVPVRRRRSGAGRDARGVDRAASARRQRAARAAARPAGGRAAAQPRQRGAGRGGAGGGRHRAAARRRRRAARHRVHRRRGADGHRRLDREPRAEPRGRAAGVGRQRSRAPAADPPPSGGLSPRSRRDRRVRRAARRVRGDGRRAAGAVVRLVGGHAARGARDDGGALRRRRAPGRRRARRRPRRGARGGRAHLDLQPRVAASRRRSPRRHARVGARGAALARDHPHRGGLAGDGLGADVRAAGAAGRGASARRAAAGVVSPAGRQRVRAVLHWRGGGDGGDARPRPEALRTDPASRRRMRDAGAELHRLGGTVDARARACSRRRSNDGTRRARTSRTRSRAAAGWGRGRVSRAANTNTGGC